MDRVLFCSGITKVSKNGIEPSSLVSSTVNLITWSVLFMWCKKFSLCSVHYITKMSSTNFFLNLGGSSTILMATSS